MFERVSSSQIYLRSQTGIQRSFTSLFNSQAALTTGQRINRPSDDPSGMRRVMGYDQERRDVQAYQANIASAETAITAATSSLQEVSNILREIRVLAVDGANGTRGPTERQSIASEIDALLGALVTVANVESGNGGYLFGGTQTQTLPFQRVTGTDGVERVDYRGDENSQRIGLSPTLLSSLNLPGSEVFSADQRGELIFRGTTGAAPGGGRASVSGNDLLQVRNSATFFGGPNTPQDPATGVRPAANALGVDTFIGSGATLEITTDATGAGTVSFDGGDPVTFVAGAASVAVRDAGGRTLSLDLSAVQPNLAAAIVPVQANATLSLDGGTTTVPVDFTATDLLVRDSETGGSLFVDATGLVSAGDEPVDFQGTYDAFGAVIALRDILNSGAEDTGDRVRDRIEDIDRIVDSVTLSQTVMGGRLRQAEIVDDRLQELDVRVQSLRSDIIDVDVAAAISDVERNETVYQATLLLAGRIRQISLLNFL